MSDLQARFAEFELEGSDTDRSTICGRAPVATLHDYTREVISYTRGAGRLSCVFDGYDPCHNEAEIVEAAQYDPAADLENTPHSVFCSHGAGVIVPWDEVDEHKHLDAGVSLSDPADAILPRAAGLARRYRISDEELEKIMLREFGPIKRRRYSEPKTVTSDRPQKAPKPKPQKPQKKMLIVDGYNLIYAWDRLRAVADRSLEQARDTLMNVLSDYVAYTKTELVLVFDAYLVKGGAGSEFLHDGYRVVFTRQDQTADAYIERMMHELGPNYNIKVVTGDRLLQLSAVHSGILRMTAREFEDEVTRIGNEITEVIRRYSEQKG
jgi:predicted RNA-binding protein with PIN domain